MSEQNAFLVYLGPGRHSGGCRYRDGSRFASGRLPEGERPAVVFCYAEGRPSQARTSLTDARANGLTLARIRQVAAKPGRYKLDCDHLLHRPLTAILGDEDLGDPAGEGFADLSERSTNRLCRTGANFLDTLPRYNANIAMQGLRAGQAVFFDFDGSGPGYLAYDLPYSSSIESYTTERITHRGGLH
jgi:Ser/Thr protein kinase RdoA (MazF antagonist)